MAKINDILNKITLFEIEVFFFEYKGKYFICFNNLGQ